MYLGSSVAASPLQPKVGSGAPVSSTQIGDWSTPTNQMSGLSWEAWVVVAPRLKPAVTMTLKPWSTNCWMSDAYSEESLGTMLGTLGSSPSAVAPATAPLKVYSLKFLSSSVPMSVTTPILRPATGEPAGADAGAEGASVAGAADMLAEAALGASVAG